MVNDNKNKQDVLSSVNGKTVSGDIENLLSILKMAKFKKLNLIKDFTNANSFRIDFLTSKAKKVFIYL